MNLMHGVIKRNGLCNRISMAKGSFDNGIISLRIERITTSGNANKAFSYNSYNKILCGVIGYISNLKELRKEFALEEENDVDVVSSLYIKLGAGCVSRIEGVYTVLIWDHNTEKVYLFQNEYCSNLPFYYVSAKDELVFGSSLKNIIKNVSFERRLNIQAARDLLYTGSGVPSNNTLLENVHKLLPGQLIVIDMISKTLEIQRNDIKKVRTGIKYAKNNLIDSIGEEVKRLLERISLGRVGVALSSGFDTNLILYFINKYFKGNIVAATIGGEKINEIPIAGKCASEYQGVTHVMSMVDAKRLDMLPDIVWRTEGYKFERGIFLANELAILLAKEKVNTVFLGDGADQRLSPYNNFTIEKIKREVLTYIRGAWLGKLFYLLVKKEKVLLKYKQNRILRPLRIPVQRIQYDVIIDYILKKCAILLNNYGIQPFYPFLNRKVGILAYSLGRLSRKKRFYKKEVKRMLSKPIFAYLCKIGGSTDLEYLLQGRVDLVKKLFENMVIKRILSKKQINEILEDPDSYPDIILQLLCIYLFNELFISGKHDQALGESGLSLTLNSFFV